MLDDDDLAADYHVHLVVALLVLLHDDVAEVEELVGELLAERDEGRLVELVVAEVHREVVEELHVAHDPVDLLRLVVALVLLGEQRDQSLVAAVPRGVGLRGLLRRLQPVVRGLVIVIVLRLQVLFDRGLQLHLELLLGRDLRLLQQVVLLLGRARLGIHRGKNIRAGSSPGGDFFTSSRVCCPPPPYLLPVTTRGNSYLPLLRRNQ